MCSFQSKVLLADDGLCQNPFCGEKDDPDNPFYKIIDPHHLLGKSHEKVEEGITFCRVCHSRCEEGGIFESVGDIYPKVIIEKNRISGREYEIKILEHIRDNRPDHFRWDGVLEEFYRKRKIV